MAKRRRRVARSMTPVKLKNRQYKKLYKITKEQVDEVNKKLKELEDAHLSGSWASGKLKNRIKSNKTKRLLYKGKTIKLKPKMTKTDLTAVQKATKQFLLSKTSTKEGIEDVKEEVKASLKDTLNLEKKGKKLTDEDIEYMYNMLADKDLARFNTKRKGKEDEFIGASALWTEIDFASSNNISEERFIERIQNLRKQDFSIDDKKAAQRIFERYVL